MSECRQEHGAHYCDLPARHRGHHHCPHCRRTWDGSTEAAVPAGDWQSSASCRGLTDLMVIPEHRGSRYPPKSVAVKIEQARKVCAGCPVAAQCLEWAVEQHRRMPWRGVVIAGHTPDELGRIAGRGPRPIRHGTAYGYQQHRTRGEHACASCLQANAAKRKQVVA